MKRFISIMMLFAFTACLIGCDCGKASAQTAPDNYLKMKGKILDGKTADITVFQQNGDNWTQVRTMKSRTNYSLKLNPEENYYVIFNSTDGLNKVLYVDAGSTGMWMMYLDINFEQRNIKYARMYQHPTNKDYSLKVVHKDNSRIIIGRESDKPNNTEVFSLHEGK